MLKNETILMLFSGKNSMDKNLFIIGWSELQTKTACIMSIQSLTGPSLFLVKGI